jgi:hypothetical protein
VQATENDPNPASASAWPVRPIPGALISTPSSGDSVAGPNFWNFGVNNFGAGCSQTHLYNTYSKVQIVYVTAVPFGGAIGTRDAIVIDGINTGNPINTLERYYYVYGYGRVREGSATSPNNGGVPFGNHPELGRNFAAINLDRSEVKVRDDSVIYAKGNNGGCLQGSSGFIHT